MTPALDFLQTNPNFFDPTVRALAGLLTASGVRNVLTPLELSGLLLAAAPAVAVWLVAEAGERTQNARTVALAALVVVGVSALLPIPSRTGNN